MLAQQPVICMGYWSTCRKRATPRAAFSTSSMNGAKAGRVCRSCGVCQLLPAGMVGRGEIMRSISARSLAFSAAASAGRRSTIQMGQGKSSWTSCFSIMQPSYPAIAGLSVQWSNCPNAENREEPMPITVQPVKPSFAAEVGDVDLGRPLSADDVAAIKAAFTNYAVLVFPDQTFSDESHLDFARHFGPLETSVLAMRSDHKMRLAPQMADVGNLDADDNILKTDDRIRLYQLGNRLWHTDSSFKRLPAYCSILHGRSIPPVGGHTEFADLRAAYDALPDATKRQIAGLVAE